MEASPLNRLPEAHSLPDGFVDSSAESPRSPTITNQPAASNEPPAAVSFPEKETLGPLLDVGPKDYKEIEQSSQSQDGVLIGISPNDSREDSHSSQQETERYTDLHASDTKEKLAADYTESLKSQKPENVEVKRKVGKRSIKSEKELLEFTLKYQKVIAERDAAVAIRERLESLCRELQRQNKMLMDECQRVSTEGQNMRLDLSNKFNDAIKDVSIKLEEQKDECLTQLKENEMLRNKLKHLADQYALTEEQFSQKLKQKSLELQIADLKIQQHQERSAQEKTQVQLYAEQVSQLLTTEKNLRLQLAADGEKFQQFQDALLKSNEVFETFKQEMEKMAKLIKELKKENEFLKGKCEKSDIALVKLVEERELMKKQLEKVKNQKEKLESLCRSLQAERRQNSVVNSGAETTSVQSKVGSAEEDS